LATGMSQKRKRNLRRTRTLSKTMIGQIHRALGKNSS
jgi:ribosomal protein L35